MCVILCTALLQAVYSELCRVLAAIHRVDIEEAGLTDFGKHGMNIHNPIKAVT